VPVVVGVRILRVVGLYQPDRYVRLDNFMEGRELGVSRAALYSFYGIAVLAIAGVVVVRRHRTVPVFPLLAPSAVVLVTVVVTYASTRFRAAAEPTLVVLAAVALNAGGTRLSSARAHRTTAVADPRPLPASAADSAVTVGDRDAASFRSTDPSRAGRPGAR
jgi:hypothetical protein